MTNWFAAPERVDEWIARGSLATLQGERAVLIFRRDNGFWRVYHVAADMVALSQILSEVCGGHEINGVLTTDLVGRATDLEGVAGIYRERGFSDHNCLIRMSRAIPAQSVEGCTEGVVFASPEDVEEASAFLRRLLDPYTDQIPEEAEIREAAVRRNLLLVRHRKALGGLLLFETVGITSHLRYWYVDDGARNQGIGARLMHRFLSLTQASKRLILWVVRDNHDAIEKYRHYGFQPEALVDRIMIRRDNSGVQTIAELLKDIRPEFDFTTSQDFVADGMLDSYDMVTLVSDLDKAYGISISGVDIVPENFQNIAAIQTLLKKYGKA